MKFIVKKLVLMLLLPNIIYCAEKKDVLRERSVKEEHLTVVTRDRFGNIVAGTGTLRMSPELAQQTGDLEKLLKESNDSPSHASLKDIADCLTPSSQKAVLAFWAKNTSTDKAALNSAMVFALKPQKAQHRGRISGAGSDGEEVDNPNQALADFTKVFVACAAKQLAEQERIHKEETVLSKEQFRKSRCLAITSFSANLLLSVWAATATALGKFGY